MTDLFHFPLVELLAIICILFAAGTTKGIIGVGLPTVAVPLLSMVLPLPTAVGAMVLPVFITNFAQAFGTERIGPVLRVLLPILAGTAAGVVIGVHLLTGLSPNILKPVAGFALVSVSVLMLLAPKLSFSDDHAPLASPFAGLVSGILGGLTGQFAPVACLYLLSRGITGNRFVQYSSLYLVVASAGLTMALGNSGALGWSGIEISAAFTIPIVLGMWIGRRLRGAVPVALSRKLVLCLIGIAGIGMAQPAVSAAFSTQGPGILVYDATLRPMDDPPNLMP